MTLADLLQSQLEYAIAANADQERARRYGIEEPEGIPPEELWNSFALPDNYCLIDSAWTIESRRDRGRLEIRFSMRGKMPEPIIHAAIERIKDANGETIASRTQPLPNTLATAPPLSVPWIRAPSAPQPERIWPATEARLGQLIASFPVWDQQQELVVPNADGWRLSFYAVLYPSEIQYGTQKDGWLFVVRFKRGPKQKSVVWGPRPLRTLRAGAEDLGGRVPAVMTLRNKRVLLLGAGAIGAPVAIELARNGCAELRLLDYDFVEPGNSIRWPFGATTWGKQKVMALSEKISADYPATSVIPVQMQLGGWIPLDRQPPPKDREENVLRRALDGTDLVMDMTAERGINWLLDDRCREMSVPLITACASPTLEGGYVARMMYGVTSGCRICLESRWSDGTIPLPCGMPRTAEEESRANMIQAPGCAELTFIGAGFDLGEISLQAVRLAVDTLSPEPIYPAGSCVHILDFTDSEGNRVPPKWQPFPLPIHLECQNQH